MHIAGLTFRIVIFPEYTGVFFSFFDLGIEQLEGRDLTEGFEFREKHFGTRSLKEFFLLHPAEAAMDRIWGGLSRRFGISILGGTCFAVKDGISGRELKNRAVRTVRLHGRKLGISICRMPWE